MHARDVILPFVYNYSKTIWTVCNNNIIFSTVKIISAECISSHSDHAASLFVRLAAFGLRGHTHINCILYIIRRRQIFFRTRLISVYRLHVYEYRQVKYMYYLASWWRASAGHRREKLSAKPKITPGKRKLLQHSACLWSILTRVNVLPPRLTYTLTSSLSQSISS